MMTILGMGFCFYIYSRLNSKEILRTRNDKYRLLAIYAVCFIGLSIVAYTFDPMCVILPIAFFIAVPIPLKQGSIIKDIIDASFLTSLMIVFVFLDYLIIYEKYNNHIEEFSSWLK